MALAISRVQMQDLPNYWPGFMQLFLEHGGRLQELSDPKHLFVAILKGDWDLWVLADDQDVKVAMLASWHVHSYDKLYNIPWMGGQRDFRAFKYVAEALEHIEAYALSHGAADVVLFGREGWGKVLAPYGYQKTGSIFEKPIRKLKGH